MKNVLSLDETPSALERSAKAATKLKSDQRICKWKSYHSKTFVLGRR